MLYRSDMTVYKIKALGNDQDVVLAARVSSLGPDVLDGPRPPGRLIDFLIKNRHGSPFEHNLFTFYVEAPIFVAREFMRHRVGWSYNETSGRYSELGATFYVPAEDRPLVQVGKPGAYEFVQGSEYQKELIPYSFRGLYSDAFTEYKWLLSKGIAREVARMVLPVGVYTSFYATCNARSLMHFLSLRTKREGSQYPSFPQREIEMVAEGMESYFKDAMPATYAAFVEHGRVAP